MARMQIVFRADASLVIGSGHVMRCLTLATGMRARGAEAVFVCREQPGHLMALIADRGFRVLRLPAPAPSFVPETRLAHAAWLGASAEEDAATTSAAVREAEIHADWIVADHYAIDAKWQDLVRPVTRHVMAIDDLADREHRCEILLDQNLIEGMNERYRGRVPEGCRTLLGPEYALLQPMYAELHEKLEPRRGKARRLFLFVGGADTDNLTGRVLDAFIGLRRSDVEMDAVITVNSPHVESVRGKVAPYGNIRLHSSLPTLAPLMAQADLAVGAGGATTWERMCLGLPSIVISLADNQRPVAEWLHRNELIDWIGDKSEASVERIAAALERALDMSSLEDWSRRCARVCAGRGTSLVAEQLMAISGN
jgi:UDP-2,4-diacetamido-2,4,6-trideoxy-beta-L-altropyranose hydrolase